MPDKSTGKFVISLDFELLWGVRDKKSIRTYGDNILGVWDVLPRMLNTFEEYSIKATFATVGFLFAANKTELLEYTPTKKPDYTNKALSPYNGHFDIINEKEDQDPYHFAPALLDLIAQHKDQEIASHTFSHYYCLEKGQTEEDFKQDISAALRIARKYGLSLNSLVFPRNQFNKKYLSIIKELGINTYRGNESAWFYKATDTDKQHAFKRLFRLIDRYIPISGHNCYSLQTIAVEKPYNIPSSRFLSPYSPNLNALEPLRLKRILRDMTHAAKQHKVYHLWWHPHNFGTHQEENFIFLEKILKHYALLHSEFGFESATMRDIAARINTTN